MVKWRYAAPNTTFNVTQQHTHRSYCSGGQCRNSFCIYCYTHHCSLATDTARASFSKPFSSDTAGRYHRSIPYFWDRLLALEKGYLCTINSLFDDTCRLGTRHTLLLHLAPIDAPGTLLYYGPTALRFYGEAGERLKNELGRVHLTSSAVI